MNSIPIPPNGFCRRFKYITAYRADPVDQRRKTCRWIIANNASWNLIGVVSWHGPWRQFAFTPEANTAWSEGCLADVRAVIQLAKEHWQQQNRPASDTKKAENVAPAQS